MAVGGELNGAAAVMLRGDVMFRRAGTTVVAATALVVAGAGVASADRGGAGGDGSGYEAVVSVTFSGDGAPGGGGGGSTQSVSMPAKCWWEPANQWVADDGTTVDPSDPEAVLEWYDGQSWSGGPGVGRETYPDVSVFEDAAARAESGEDITWYRVVPGTGDGSTCSPDDFDAPGGWDQYIGYMWYTTGNEPEPSIDPEVLAIEAREQMEIDEPEFDRNPKIDQAGGGTFVDFPTWFWVTNPESVGGENGTRTIRADIEGSDVYAEVTAKTGGLSLSAPTASQSCDPSTALVTWSPDASNGCVVNFPKASTGYSAGYPVTASTQWDATWEGLNDAGESVGGGLEPLSRSAAPVNIPVAEVQTIVQ